MIGNVEFILGLGMNKHDLQI